MQKASTVRSTKNYYANKESKWGYRLLLKGNRHFGYYPQGKENISFAESQYLMEEKLANKLSLKSGSRVLDAGCGEGNTALHLAKNYSCTVDGVDLLQESITIARKKAKLAKINNVSFQIGNYSEINLGKEKYDAIYTMETLVHVKNYDIALRKFFRALKKGGRLVLFEYTREDPQKLTTQQQHLWNQVCDLTAMEGLRQFFHGSFPKKLLAAGFKDINVEEITEQISPMLKRFYEYARIPYFFIKLFGLQKYFPNAFFSVETYQDIIKNQTWKYVVVTAIKD